MHFYFIKRCLICEHLVAVFSAFDVMKLLYYSILLLIKLL